MYAGDPHDRTVHAIHTAEVDGQTETRELARYNRQGRWYAEWTAGPRKGSRQALTLTDAVDLALDMEERGGKIFIGRTGGLAFDGRVRKAKK